MSGAPSVGSGPPGRSTSAVTALGKAGGGLAVVKGSARAGAAAAVTAEEEARLMEKGLANLTAWVRDYGGAAAAAGGTPGHAPVQGPLTATAAVGAGHSLDECRRRLDSMLQSSPQRGSRRASALGGNPAPRGATVGALGSGKCSSRQGVA
ncbi:hypothetical protein WJX81_006575 [Elliptochloris bilobata]|uniref:Uncharacterized protein n=1 Tax=Elliptochloris bilobata TaxID=381761 RepID=A0AAW1S9J0_9CHLO